MTRVMLIWAAVLGIALGPMLLAATSPLLAWRGPIYIAAGFAGIIAMALLVLQPLLILGKIPGATGPRARRYHRALGLGIVGAILGHVGGLWITSPPDVIDALLLRAPTMFSTWGVLAMWALFGSAALAVVRRRFTQRIWRRLHLGLGGIIAVATGLHVVMIEGTMESVSKGALAISLVIATAWAAYAKLKTPERPDPKAP